MADRHGFHADVREAGCATVNGSLGPLTVGARSNIHRERQVLFDHYRHRLEALGNEKGTLGLIFGKAQNNFQDPAKLRRMKRATGSRPCTWGSIRRNSRCAASRRG